MGAKINKLDDIEKKNPFAVPENYFTNFNQEIMSKLPKKETIKPKKVTLWDRVQPWIYMAAMFAGLYFMIQVLVKQQSSSTNNSAQNTPSTLKSTHNDDYWSSVQISEDEFYQYLEDQIISDDYYDYMYNQVNLN